MAPPATQENTFIPSVDGNRFAPVLSFLEAHQRRRGSAVEPRYALVGADEHDRIELPAEVHGALTQVVAALSAGKAVAIAPRSLTLTSQQAADVLGVSRPTVKRLIEKGELPAERIGTRHRLQLDEVLAYREQRRQRQYDALAATADPGFDDDPDEVRRRLREIRRSVADRHTGKG